jgi:hypothetical protein
MPGLGRGGIEPGEGRLPPPDGALPPPRGPGAGLASPGRAARSPPGPPPGRGACGRGAGAPAPTPNGLLPGRGARGPGLGDCGRGGTTWPPPCAGGSCCLGAAGAGFAAGLAAGASVWNFAAAGCGAAGAGLGPGRAPGFGAALGAVLGRWPCGAGAWVCCAGFAGAGGRTSLCAGVGFPPGLGPGEPPGRGREPPPFEAPDLAPSDLGYASRNRRATGASTVDDADFTNSPSSFSFARTSLLVTPSSFASSCTRALPATALLVRVRPAAWSRSTSSYRLAFMASASRLTHDGSTCFR